MGNEKKTKKKQLPTYTLLEDSRRWELSVDGLTFSVSKHLDYSSWTVIKTGVPVPVVDQGDKKTLEECLIEMGNKYGCKFVLESEKAADIRIFGKPIACKRY